MIVICVCKSIERKECSLVNVFDEFDNEFIIVITINASRSDYRC